MMTSATCAVLLLSLLVTLAAGGGAYYNGKYAADGISYETDDDFNGLWDTTYTYVRDAYSGYPVSTGCAYDDPTNVVTSCTGSTVYLGNLDMVNITRGTFAVTTTSITINNCPSFELFESRTFENLTSLTFLEVQGTILNHVPDVSNTALETLNLAGNAVYMDSNTHRGWTMPTSIKRLFSRDKNKSEWRGKKALMENQIYWIPAGMVSGPNLRIASFANNKLPQLQQSIFGDVSALVYFGADGNQITTISKNTITPLATNNFLHLNLSNNELTFIQNNAFKQFPSLKILELHGNNMSSIQSGTFSNLDDLVHLDLHGNKLVTVETRTFENLPQLKELRLHSQQTPMTSISWTAWSNIGDELLELFVSSNELVTFPHQVLEEGYYPKLHTIHADNNKIANATEYGSEAFSRGQSFLASKKALTITPFSAYPNLTTLFLNDNLLTYVNNTDFCGMAKLEELYINSNLIREAYMDVDAFQCLPVLRYLNMDDNLVQYVPEALKTSAVVPALQELVLSSNQLTFLESDAFSGVTTLITLNLASNRILAIENGAFPSQIETIELGSNDFRFLHELPFGDLSSLTSLGLSNNEIQFLPDNAFQNCTALTTLNLQSNNIPQLKKVHFENCPLTTSIVLSSNDIGWIEDGTFSHITSTQTISLSYNKLTSLPEGGSFNDLTVSRSLDLSNNRINVLRTDNFKNLNVYSLSLSGNMIVKIESYAFNTVTVTLTLSLGGSTLRQLNEYSFHALSCSDLYLSSSTSLTNIPARAFSDVSGDEIFLQSSAIETIEEAAFTDVNVRNLDISSNNLVALPNAIFGGSSSVSQDLEFSNNEIVSVAYDFFNNVTVGYVNFNNNNLTSYPLALTTTNFTRIYLSSNFISEITSEAFAGQVGLQRIYLDNNQITTLAADAFTGLTSLQYLYLYSNQLSTLSASQFDGLTSLRYLYLYSNQLTHVYSFDGSSPLTELLLYSNDIETLDPAAFSALSSGSLSLSDNPLECSCQLVETLHAVSSRVVSGTCSQIAAASGVTFASSSSDATNYYASADIGEEVFQCGENLNATVVSGTEFKLAWDHPANVYVNLNATATSLEGPVVYYVTCISNSAPTLTATVPATVVANDTTPVETTFNTNVQAGTSYECSVTLEINGTVSANSVPEFLITPDATVTPGTAGPNDITLGITYYDFSKAHADFDDSNYITVSNPTYVSSPYGPWLAASATPTADTFSEWFRSDASVNYEFEDTIILVADTGNVKTYWTDSFFPVDGSGFTAESQQDCNGTYHNFGFTSAVRTGLVFNGLEVITVAGGEALWLYIHQTKILEFVSTGQSPAPCFVVDLSPASTTGGQIFVQEGVISNGACTSSVTSSTGVSLELETGVTYHFDLFHAETRTCTSELLLQVENVVFSQNVAADLPLTYTFDIDEDAQVGEIVGTVDLADVFSVGGYTVTLYSGNEYRRLTIEESTYTFTPVAETPPTYTNFTDIDGNDVAFVECAFLPSAKILEFPDNSAEVFPISTSTIHIRTSKELDYDEKEQEYYLLVEVEDTGKSLTGYIGIRVRVIDVNDNCPSLTPSVTELSPEPVLQQTALMTFTSADIDSGENANICFVVSQVTEDPPVDYDDTMDLWDNVYLGYTVLAFTVIAVDNGTIPRGTTATVNVTVSNTCMMDVRYGKIVYGIYVNDTTGELTYRVPKYWMQDFTCSDDVGLTLGYVLDTMMSASSSFDDVRTGPGRGRVNNTENVFSELAGAWVAGVVDTSQYLEVDMGSPYRFTAVHTQGRSDAEEWVTSYKIQYYDNDTAAWVTYSNGSGVEVFNGNNDRTTVVSQVLDPVILAQKIRINPQTWNAVNISLRLEYSGCTQAEQLFYDVSCMRCETSYYCEGDGVSHTCGRCENASVTCDRDPTEHSFGHASECTTCPVGWLCANGTASPCPDLYYAECTNTSCSDSCTPCEPGYACDDGIRSLCSAGTYSDGSLETCEPCDSGTYQDQTGQTACLTCDPGYYSNRAKSQCDLCDTDTYSVGVDCVGCPDNSVCPCLGTSHGCFDASLCYNTGSGGHGCLTSCNPGYTGDGITCIDIDECFENRPCFMDRCINTSPGYQCLECPDGYVGTYEDAYSWTLHRRVFEYKNLVRSAYENQTCEDVDECASDNGGCDPLMTCVNTAGSYYCGPCASGYLGTNKTGCYLDDYCVSGVHDCIAEAECVYLGPAQYRCECSPGYAGTGTYCGLDSDLDGFPDVGLSCTHWGCSKDNCVSVSNSMQFDTDGDNSGDNCDSDDDNDGRYDYLDNCVGVANFYQNDTDGDGVGDVCDNCPALVNADQVDTDNDGAGDECDTDDDNDGVADVSDNCRTVANVGQENSDGDSHGNACDNCPLAINEDQADSNNNLVGDVCEDTDSDGDGIGDSSDNCPAYMNGDQSDVDGDGLGDLCDDDIDGDGVTNTNDNCPYVSNSAQTFADSQDVGVACETDSDGDGVIDSNDTCPYNPDLSATSFLDHFTVDLDPSLIAATAPVWVVKKNGGEVMQTASTAMPTMLIGTQTYGAIEYQGTWFTTDTGAEDYVGCVFGYVSSSRFYAVMWRRTHYNYLDLDQSTYQGGIKGIQIKLVDSTTGPGSTLTNALWHSWTTANQVTMLWQDPDLQDWATETAYRWYITHLPSTGYINLKVYQGTSLLVDSGAVYDMSITGGRVGVLQFGEFPLIFSNLRVNCLDHTNQALYLDGVDDYATLDDVTTLQMEESFSIELWLSLDAGFTAGPYPVVCSAEADVCLSVESGQLHARYFDYETNSSTTTLAANTWYNIIFRHSIEDGAISLHVDGTQVGVTSDVPLYNVTDLASSKDLTMYIGKENNTYFRGSVDEVRFYSMALQDIDIAAHIGLTSIERPVLKAYGTLHFRMEDSVTSSSLANSGRLTSHTATLNGGTFVTSYQQGRQYAIVNP